MNIQPLDPARERILLLTLAGITSSTS